MRHYQLTTNAPTVNKPMVIYGARIALDINFFVNHAACYYTELYLFMFLSDGIMVSLVKHHCMLKDTFFILDMLVIHVLSSHYLRWTIAWLRIRWTNGSMMRKTHF